MDNLDLPIRAGPGQRPTPVATFTELLKILSLLSDDKAKALRAQQANITSRAVAGDRDLEAALPVQRERLGEDARRVVMNGLESSNNANAQTQILDQMDRKINITSWLLDLEDRMFQSMNSVCQRMTVIGDERDRLYVRPGS